MAHAFTEIQGETKLWRLQKHSILGKGSFGLAILYTDLDTNEFVVVKDMNLQCVKKAADVEALHTEIQILKKTSTHPNIVHYLDSFFDGKFTMQIIMEYCDGGDLGDLIQRVTDDPSRRAELLNEDTILSLLVQILMGLTHLHHDHRILHRDLKPQNIFLRKDGVAKIGDFGVSTILSQNVEFAKTFCGSPYYLAPELCQEQRYNGKADLWSVGVMLYEMIAGKRPFEGKNLVTLIMLITKAEYPPLDEPNGCSASLCDIAHSLLQLHPEARPALKRLLRGTLITSSVRRILPSYCLDNSFYRTQFGLGPTRLVNNSQSPPNKTAVDEAAMLAEMEAWASKDKAALLHDEVRAGLKPTKDVVDAKQFDRYQKSELLATTMDTVKKLNKEQQQQSSPTPMVRSSTEGAVDLSLTASASEEAWNQHYDDDDFENDDDELSSEPLRVPLAERSFQFR